MSLLTAGKLTLAKAGTAGDEDEFAREVARGLTLYPKKLPFRFLYDEAGSLLFEEICKQPEYYPTRTELAILQEYADDIASSIDDFDLVELGSGSCVKTRIVIEACLARFGELRFVPVDISETMLETSAHELQKDYPELDIYGIAADYQDGLEHAHAQLTRPKLIMWLGSSVGNLEPEEAIRFLGHVADVMEPEDRLLLGMDLLKDSRMLEQAYNDANGITAAFNKNLLTRINRELGGHFDLEFFEHKGIVNKNRNRVEMHLFSLADQRVLIDKPGLDVGFERGESIHTENSHKFTLEQIEELASAANLVPVRQWFDDRRLFSLNLFARRE